MLGHLYYFNKNCFIISLLMCNVFFDVYECLISILSDCIINSILNVYLIIK